MQNVHRKQSDITKGVLTSALLMSMQVPAAIAQEAITKPTELQAVTIENSDALEKVSKYVLFDETLLDNFEVSQKQNDYEMDLAMGDQNLPGANGPIIVGKDDKGLTIELSLVSKGNYNAEQVLECNEKISQAIEASISGSSNVLPLNSIGPAFSNIESKGQLKVIGQSVPYLIGKCPERPGTTTLFGVFAPKNKNMMVLITAMQPGSGKFDIAGTQDFLSAIKLFIERRNVRPHWGTVLTQEAIDASSSKFVDLRLPLPGNFQIKEVNRKLAFVVIENLSGKQVILIRAVARHKPNSQGALALLEQAKKGDIANRPNKAIPLKVNLDFTKLLQGAPYKAISSRGKLPVGNGKIDYFTGISAMGWKTFVGLFDSPSMTGSGLDIMAMQLDNRPFNVKALLPLLAQIRGTAHLAKNSSAESSGKSSESFIIKKSD